MNISCGICGKFMYDDYMAEKELPEPKIYTYEHDAYFCSRICAETYVKMMEDNVEEECKRIKTVTVNDLIERQKDYGWEMRYDAYWDR